jgi:hypothetical protein
VERRSEGVLKSPIDTAASVQTSCQSPRGWHKTRNFPWWLFTVVVAAMTESEFRACGFKVQVNTAAFSRLVVAVLVELPAYALERPLFTSRKACYNLAAISRSPACYSFGCLPLFESRQTWQSKFVRRQESMLNADSTRPRRIHSRDGVRTATFQ